MAVAHVGGIERSLRTSATGLPCSHYNLGPSPAYPRSTPHVQQQREEKVRDGEARDGKIDSA
jgi:hypothetical protein